MSFKNIQIVLLTGKLTMLKPANIASGIIKKYAAYLMRTDWRIMVFFFAVSLIYVGFLTEPRFNDGIYHLEAARLWYTSGSFLEVNRSVIKEPPLWYFIVQTLGYLLNGNIPIAAQIVQSICYTGILISTYKITSIHTKSDLTAKCALIFTATIPMVTVTSILCFIDVICAFFIILSVLFLYRKKFFSAILACAGVWYSKRTGILELVPFFIVFSAYIYAEKGFKVKKTIVPLFMNGIFFLLIILPSLGHRLESITATRANSLSLDPSKLAVISGAPLTHSPHAAKGLPLNDILIWTGGVLAALAILWLIALTISKYRNIMISCWGKNYSLPFIFFMTVLLISIFPLGRVTIRYWAIVIALGVATLTISLMKTPFKCLVLLLTSVAILQQALVLVYVFKKRRVSESAKQVLNILKDVPQNRKIVWNESLFGKCSLGREIYWENELKYLLIKSKSDNMKFGDIGAIVVTKRFLYHFKDEYYDRGIPFFLFEKYKKSRQLQTALDNNDYCVFLFHEDKSDL